MRRFNSEADLESHAPGRSFPFLVRDADDGLENVSHRLKIVLPPNPFDAVRARLAMIDLTICGLHNQVQLIVCFCCTCDLQSNKTVALHKTPSLSNCL